MARAAPILLAVCLSASLCAIGCGNRARALVSVVDDGGGVVLPPGATPVSAAPSAGDLPLPAWAPAAPAGQTLVRLEPVSFAPIAHAADPSVVTINTVGEEANGSPFGRRHPFRGLGTGFVVDRGGIILTNNHVIEGADAVEVKLFDDRVFAGKVAGSDSTTDIAVVRIDAKDLRPLPLGDSDALEVGDWVVAIGNPFGLSHTVSAGIISAKGRTSGDVQLDPTGYYDFLQTDASINPGNSGGPLLNLKGQVVGMNSAIRGGGAQGIGFAIPINMMKQLLPMLLRDGRVTRSALGINIFDARELSEEDRATLKIGRAEKITGAVIERVLSGGAAGRAHLQLGDIILAFDGQTLERSSQLQWMASTAGVGRTVTLRVRREGKVFDVPVTLGRLNDEPRGPSR
jgi:serine protease Do